MGNIGTGEWIVIGLSLLIGLFFVLGNWFNNQRADNAMHWLRQGLSEYGALKSSRFNAPTSKGIAFQIVPSASCPYQRIQGILILERRENLPLWIFQRMRGKRDILQMTSDLHDAPNIDLHISQKSFLPKGTNRQAGSENTPNEIIPVEGSSFFITENEPPSPVEQVSQLISRLPVNILDLAIHRKSPHLTFQIHLSAVLPSDPQSFFQSLQKGIEQA